MSKALSEHFQEKEFWCPCQSGTGSPHCTGLPKTGMSVSLIGGLELLRMILDNRPLVITSGYRCTAHQDDDKSQHTKGRAADVYSQGIDWFVLLQAAERVPQFKAGGIGIYPALGNNGAHDFIHVDTRSTGTARWGRWHGEYLGIEAVKDLAWVQGRANTPVTARQRDTSITGV